MRDGSIGGEIDVNDPNSSGNETLDLPHGEGAGERIGPFKLLQPLGEGGFGSVYEAEQEQPVRRRVALKIIKLGMDTREVIARFEAERQALALMDHPHIAHVFDAGATESGRPYFVMELVKGEPLSAYCRRHRLSVRQRLELFAQVCAAVQHAHAKGIIHRDLKPGNVLVSTQDTGPFAKVIDFGIAKATSGRLTDKTLFTERFLMMGSPLYMSPEQAEGEADIDARTDVYSLGVILYELLTDTTPIDSASLRAAAAAEVQRVIRDVEPPSPSARLRETARKTASRAAADAHLEDTARTVRGELDWIVMKAIEKDRTRRYATANALAMDVQHYLDGEPVLAAPPGAGYRLGKLVRRHRQPILAAALVAFALAAGVAGTAWWGRQHAAATTAGVAIPLKSIAVLPFENLSADKANAYFAEGMQDEILTRLAKISALKVISRTSTQKYASRPENLREIAQQLGVANILEGSVQKVGNAVHINVQLIRADADAHLWAESYDRTLDNLFGVEGEVAGAIADKLNAKLSGAERQELAAKPTQNAQAYDAYLRGLAIASRTDSNDVSLNDSVAAFEEAARLDPKFFEAWAWLARQHSYAMFGGAGASDTHRTMAHDALETAKRLAPDSPATLLAEGYYHYWVERDYGTAARFFERVRTLSPNASDAEFALALIERRRGHWTESASLLEQAVEKDPRNTALLIAQAGTLAAMQDFKGAQRALDRAFLTEPDDNGVLVYEVTLLLQQAETALARPYLERMRIDQNPQALINLYLAAALDHDYSATAIARITALLKNAEHLPRPWLPRSILGYAFGRSGNAAAAKSAYLQALEEIQPELRAHPDDVFLLLDLSHIEAGLGDGAAALAAAKREVALLPESKDALLGPYLQEDLARRQAQFGDRQEAIRILQHLSTTPYTPRVTAATLRLDPDFDNLRGDPRFQALLK